MVKILAGLAVAACVAAAPAMAASPLDGTWKADFKSAKLPTKPDDYLLQDGTFTCRSCAPELKVAADGAWHKVTGHPYYDETMVKVVDAHTVKMANRKGGKLMSEQTMRVSADGKTLSLDGTDHSADVPVSSKGTDSLIAKGPTGSHAISGRWKQATVEAVSDSGLIYTYKTTGDMLMLSTPAGYAYSAKWGGPAVPVKGDKANTMAAVRKTGANSFVETDSRGGKTVSVMTTTVSADGKTQTVVVDDKEHGTTMSYKAMKQ